jgi:hypothetical protein
VIDLIRMGRRARTRLGPPLFVLALLLVAITVMSACTGGTAGSNDGVATLNSADPGASAAPSASLNPQDALLAYARCMREHGVDMPDPQFDESDGKFNVQIGVQGGKPADKKTVDAAQQACQHFMEGVAFGPGKGGEVDQETQEKLLAFARCMREHDIDFPDPQFDGSRVIVGGGTSGPAFDPNSQKFKNAQDACRSLLPGGGKDFGFSSGTNDGKGPSTDSGSQP